VRTDDALVPTSVLEVVVKARLPDDCPDEFVAVREFYTDFLAYVQHSPPSQVDVSPADVRQVLGDTDLDTASLDAFIRRSRRYYIAVINEDIEPPVAEDVVVRLAAHFVATGPERQVDSAGEGGGNVSFSGQTGEGLMATSHGQVARTLDPTGELADESDGGDDVVFSA